MKNMVMHQIQTSRDARVAGRGEVAMRIARCSAGLGAIIVASACMLPQTTTSAPVPTAKFDFVPANPCEAPGATKLTLAVVAPRWQAPGATTAASMVAYPTYNRPRVLLDLAQSMRADFLELATCRGYLTKGPFDSFEAMVYPDREASQLLLEPELSIEVSFTRLDVVQKMLLGGIVRSTSARNNLAGDASVGGRVTLALKEPVTNTRMWTRSIEVPADAFDFVTENVYPLGMTHDQAEYYLVHDPGVQRQLVPKLEAMYASVFTTAQNYLDVRELATVARQAADVRKKASIRVPPE